MDDHEELHWSPRAVIVDARQQLLGRVLGVGEAHSLTQRVATMRAATAWGISQHRATQHKKAFKMFFFGLPCLPTQKTLEKAHKATQIVSRDRGFRIHANLRSRRNREPLLGVIRDLFSKAQRAATFSWTVRVAPLAAIAGSPSPKGKQGPSVGHLRLRV